ncbi:MAG: transglycosylase family protein [Propionibacteriaceae bacterium]|nr:transglycosylase family protein [Propionibacteriaceae bacterium]
MGYVLILLGLGVLGVACAALIRGHIGWARIPSRKTAMVAMVVGVVVLVIVGALTPQPPAGTTANSAPSTARSAPSSTSTIATTAPRTTANASSKTPAAGGGNTVAATAGPADSSVWDTLAECESGGNWAINTGNGLYGGVQIDRGTWLSYGGRAYAPLPSKATREQQILIAEKVRADRGFSPWSSCARKLGLL